MNEREQALRLAYDLDRQLTDPNASPEQTGQEDQALLRLVGRLSGHSPFVPNATERVRLRQQFEQARSSRSTHPSWARSVLLSIEPALKVALIAAILIVAFIGISILISDLLKIPRPIVAGPALHTSTPETVRPVAGTYIPATTPSAPTETPIAEAFPIQAQTADGIRLELRDLKTIGSSFRATLCYQPPDQRNWRLEEVTLHTVEADGVFYPSSSAQPSPGADGQACETFTAAIPNSWKVGSIDITVKRLVALRETTPDCDAINQQLAQDYPGMSLRCNSAGSGFGWTVEKSPADMSTAKLRRVEQTYIENDVHSGPWNFSVSPTQVTTMVSSDFPADPVVVPGACADTSRYILLDPQIANGLVVENPAGIAGSGTYGSGQFAFTLVLACDPNFSRLKMAGDDDSEINGLGIVYTIAYQGEGTIEKVENFDGPSPFVLHSGGGGSMRSGDMISGWEGLRFPENARPDFHQVDVRLRYQVKVRTGEGAIEGAALVFTLQREAEGYRPVDVVVEPLTDAEKKTVESDLNAPAPFPLQATTATPISAEAQALLDLTDRWQQPMLATPGWVHLRTRVEMPTGNGLYAGLTEYRTDEWYQIDAQGMVNTLIHVDSRLDGAVLQQAVSQNGKTTNLTYGMGGDFKPYKLDLAWPVTQMLKFEKNVKQGGGIIDGKRVVLLEVSGAVMQRVAVDAASGAWLYSETGKIQAGDQGDGFILDNRTTLEAAERVDAPPYEAQALLGKEFSGYTPPDPYGTPAPDGFDPSKSKLVTHLVPGDKFEAPSFWYGDITAEGYLLGRVDFGRSAGSFCARSADGSKLAFNYTKSTPDGHTDLFNSLRWFDLRSVQDIHQPAPELTQIGTLSWSNKEEKLAFFGCQDNQKNCGLYRLDPASGKVDQLVPGVYSVWPIIWKPDGSQLAFITTLKEPNKIIVIDFDTGKVVYQGSFNADAWQVPGDSPTNQWGVSFPRGQEGNACFVVK